MAIVFEKSNFMKKGTLKESVTESVKRILMTTPGERLNNPTFGSNVKSTVFELSLVAPDLITESIISSISRFEPRVLIQNIDYTIQDNALFFILKLFIIATGEQVETSFEVNNE